MSIAEQRARARRRLEHLQELENEMPAFNVRSMLGVASVFDALDYGTYGQLYWASQHLVGTNLLTSYDRNTKIQERELHVALTGPGDERGRVEFEVERTFGYLKYELTVKVRNADVGSSHAFLVDGMHLGNVTVNQNGIGRLYLSTDPSNGEQPFVGGVPEIKLGSEIRVGDILEATVGGAADSTDNSIHAGEVEIDLFGSTAARGSAQLELDPEDGGLKREFKVKIDRAVPGRVLDVVVGGINVGQFTVDEDGKAEMEFSTDPNFDERPFPPNFPDIAVGTSVEIGGLVSGTFNRIPDLGPNGTGSVCDEREFKGGLWSSNTAVRGGAKFEIQLEDGGFLENEFRVHVRNGLPGESHQIRVDGVFVGSVTINGEGRGRIEMSNRMNDDRELALPDFFPEIHDGTVVEVGDHLRAQLREFASPCGFLTLSDPVQSMISKRESADHVTQNIFAVPF